MEPLIAPITSNHWAVTPKLVPPKIGPAGPILAEKLVPPDQWRSQGGAHWGTCPTNFILCPTKFFLVNLQITTITLFKQIVNYIPNIPKPSMILHQSIWSLNGSLLDHKFR